MPRTISADVAPTAQAWRSSAEATSTQSEPLEPTPELLAELREADVRLETAWPEEIIVWGAKRFGPRLAMATAFGPADVVVQSLHHDLQSLHNFVHRDLPKAAPEITRTETFQVTNVLKSSWTWGDWFMASDR